MLDLVQSSRLAAGLSDVGDLEQVPLIEGDRWWVWGLQERRQVVLIDLRQTLREQLSA
jgi:hypothetical protein